MEYAGTIAVALILLLIVGAIIWRLARARRRGHAVSCPQCPHSSTCEHPTMVDDERSSNQTVLDETDT
ncbi:MAG: FeoB-associated Cys-rich membrane protein [Coriobacteriales bacterium]|jgi:hypothetical protein|nr:FeoB-associated Cys-rich membrane protein [Coriobacteriales bacterium]